MAARSKRKRAPKWSHSERFPGESVNYRAAREKLLRAEIAVRRAIEEAAKLRRRLPVGGPVPEDYVFEEGTADPADTLTVRRVRMSELFKPGHQSLVVYSFMYGPNMDRPCPSCTSILDSLDGAARHVTQRASLVVVAKSPLQRIRMFARERGWRNLRLLSSAGNHYGRDYYGEDAKGAQWPVLNVFERREGGIHHFYATELLFTPPDPGQEPRHVDLLWPLWNVFDAIREGRGTDWQPRLAYD